MSRTLLYNASYITVEYDSAHYIYINWKGYLALPQIREGTYRILDALLHYQCTDLLNDNREVLGNWTQSIRFLANEILPKFLAAGLKKVAFIYSKSASARYSLDRFLETNDQYIGQTFEDYPSSLEWLTQNRVVETRLENSLAIREKGQHKLINISDIHYAYVLSGECVICAGQHLYTTRTTLRDLLLRLPADQFMQVHRSYVINVNVVSSLQYYAGGAYHVYLRNMPRNKIPVSASYVAALKIRLGIVEKGGKDKMADEENDPV